MNLYTLSEITFWFDDILIQYSFLSKNDICINFNKN